MVHHDNTQREDQTNYTTQQYPIVYNEPRFSILAFPFSDQHHHRTGMMPTRVQPIFVFRKMAGISFCSR